MEWVVNMVEALFVAKLPLECGSIPGFGGRALWLFYGKLDQGVVVSAVRLVFCRRLKPRDRQAIPRRGSINDC